MKKLMVVLYVCSVSALMGQSVQEEINVINVALKDGDLMGDDARERARLIRELEAVYPVMPYDSASGEMAVVQLITFPGVSKSAAFKRVKEWASLNFGSLDAVLHYEDMETGKLIIKGWMRVWYSATFKNIWGNEKSFPEDRQLLFTLVVTVKDGKAKVEYRNLRYKHSIPGSMVGSTYVPLREYEYPLTAAFPLALSPMGEWRGKIDLLNKTLESLKSSAPSVQKHIRDLSKDYDF